MQPNSTSPSTGPRLANNQTSIIRSPPTKRRRTTFSNNPPNNNISSSSQSSPSPPPSLSPSPSRSPSPQPNISSRVVNPAKWFRKPNVVWYRGHDLRVDDHPSLLQAAQRGGPVVPLFIWDEEDEFGANLGHEKSWWLKESLKRLSQDLRRLGVKLYTRKGRSADQLREFLAETGADAVYWNRFYIPSLLQRDEELRIELSNEGFTAESFVSELLVEPWEITNTKTHPCFETFSEYRRKWKTVRPPPEPFPSPSRLSPIQRDITDVGIQNLGLNVSPQVAKNLSKIWTPGSAQAKLRLSRFLHDIFPLFGEERYRKNSDGSSRLSPHVRFGEISPRRMYHATRLRVIQWDSSVSHAYNTAHGNLCRRSFRQKPGEERQCSPPITEHRETYHEKGIFFNTTRNRSSTPTQCMSISESPAKSSTAQINQPTNLCKRVGQHQIRRSARAFLKNLCLRDFSYHVLFHNPDFNRKPLIPEFNLYPWAKDEGSFDAWIGGRTGYPIIDAAMRELRATGWIHNRLRFLLACFLTKYLLLPWAKGLEKFYSLLLDGDRSANALGWQWTSGSNSDSFPLSCLVNPVKFAAIFDPNGHYIRKWIPELTELGTEYIHQPWKAKQEYLKTKNIVLGSTYPQRIVTIAEARSRALSAMTFMKHVCATTKIPRGVRGVIEEEQITEWPDKQLDLLRMDEENSMPGKLNLLPSLWAMLQCDQTPSYLTSSGTGNDNLIAMDTASLVEGALAVPLEDQNVSIEHALITAHEHANTSVGLSIPCAVSMADRFIDVGSFPQAPECETEAEMADNSTENVEMQNLDDQLKYPDGSMNVFSERGKSVDEPSVVERSVSGSTQIQVPNEARASQESKLASDPGSISCSRLSNHQNGIPHASVLPQQPLPSQLQNSSQIQHLQQLRHFQQFQALQRHQERSQLAQQQTARHMQSTNYNETNQTVKVSEKPTQPASNFVRTSVQQNPSVSGVENGAKIPSQLEPPGQLGNETVPQGGSHNRQSQPEFTSIQDSHISQPTPGFTLNNVEQTYLPPNSINRNHTNGVHPVAGNQIIMGAGIPTTDGKGVQEFSVGESPNPVYHPQLGVNPFYGFQHVVSMMNPHILGGTDRQDMLPTTSPANQAKMTMPGVVPFGYGMYPGGLFDPTMLTGTFPAGNSYGPPVVASQPQGHPSNHQASYSLSSHPMYYSPSTNCGPLPMQNSITGQLPENVTQPARIVSSQPQLQNSIPLTTSAPVSEGFRTDISKDVTINLNPQKVPTDANRKSQVQQSGSKKVSNARTGPLPTKMKTGSRARPVGRNRRGGASTGGSKGRTGKLSSRARGSDSSHPSRAIVPRSPTTLKKRQEILTSVLEKSDHEYFGFAQYLSATYELTGNTDRHTSKDFVRLCNLKDDYHKRCNSEKEKLKIYRIKAFFSQILKLEVTGEWDRHMHGGVRGPYVYGIRARRRADTSNMETVAG